MHTTKYLIVGGGMTGDWRRRASASTTRRLDHARRRGAAPALQAAAAHEGPLGGRADEEKIWREHGRAGVELVTGRRIVSLDLDGARRDRRRRRGVRLGEAAARDRRPPARAPAAPKASSTTARSTTTAALRARRREGAHVVVIGGGFIGSEIAAALVGNGCRVTMVFPEPGIGCRALPGRALRVRHRLLPREGRRGARRRDASQRRRATGSTTGVRPDARGRRRRRRARHRARTPSSPRPPGSRSTTGSSSTSTAACRGARTSSPPATSRASRSRRSARALRVEHEDHANTHGRPSARTWPAPDSPYDHLPFFYSDLFDLGYEAVGEVDSRLEAVEGWQEPNRKGVVAYVEDGKPRGFLLWNVWDKVDAARDLIRRPPIEGALAV